MDRVSSSSSVRARFLTTWSPDDGSGVMGLSRVTRGGRVDEFCGVSAVVDLFGAESSMETDAVCSVASCDSGMTIRGAESTARYVILVSTVMY